MLHELRTIGRGGGNLRDLERRLGGTPAAVFQTEVGTAGETIVLSEHRGLGDAAPAPEGGGRRLQTGGLSDIPNQRVELLRPAPFMAPFGPVERGRVWELRWLEFPPGGAAGAVEAFAREDERMQVAGCWTVDTGPWLDRLYILSGFKDWDQAYELMSARREDPDWPPETPVAATSGGSSILLPAAFSVWK
jgi:hypothetical protein